MTRLFDPHRSPNWQEQVEHAETWSDTSPEALRAEWRGTWLRRLAVVAPLAVVVAAAVAFIWLGGA